jgi:hypothetical protein
MEEKRMPFDGWTGKQLWEAFEKVFAEAGMAHKLLPPSGAPAPAPDEPRSIVAILRPLAKKLREEKENS